MFSAKGAPVISSLGQRPMIREIPKSPALKARFTFEAGSKANDE
jgi:hypothetical protein